MEKMLVENLVIYYDLEEIETAEILRDACERSIQRIRDSWGLTVPEDCRVYVMTSWSKFLFHAAPWHWKILLAITFPIWMIRVRRLWRFAGGWMQRFGSRCTVGVKPAWLIELADRTIGARIFVPEENIDQKVQLTTCHELTHAFTAHLKLPMWLNEGLAMVMVDKFHGSPTVRRDTLEPLKVSQNSRSPSMYQKVSTQDRDALVYHTVRGYWITRYLEDTNPDLLKAILTKRYSHKDLEAKIASAYDMTSETFWEKIDGILVTHFLTNR
jgi:hypothetical protein